MNFYIKSNEIVQVQVKQDITENDNDEKYR